MKAGMKGQDEDHDPHMLDACDLISEAREEASERRLSRCWIKAEITPQGTDRKLIGINEKVKREKRLLKKRISRQSRKCFQRYNFTV